MSTATGGRFGRQVGGDEHPGQNGSVPQTRSPQQSFAASHRLRSGLFFAYSGQSQGPPSATQVARQVSRTQTPAQQSALEAQAPPVTCPHRPPQQTSEQQSASAAQAAPAARAHRSPPQQARPAPHSTAQAPQVAASVVASVQYCRPSWSVQQTASPQHASPAAQLATA